MSLIPSFFSRTSFDPYFRALDFYDPYDELDYTLNPLHWFRKPDFLSESPMVPRVPQKYRITVDCAGFTPGSIKTEFIDNNQKLVVSAKEESKTEGSDDYSLRHFKKTYTLPPNACPDQMINFMTGQGQLVIEVPLKETEREKVSDLFPQIVDAPEGSGGGKQVMLKFNVPQHIDPNKVSVNVKGHDLIFRAEDVIKKSDGVSKFHYFQRTTLPEHTELGALRCVQDNNQVIVTAPLTAEAIMPAYRKVPIEKWSERSQPQLQQQPQPQQQQQAEMMQKQQQSQLPAHQYQQHSHNIKNAQQAGKPLAQQ